LIVLFKTTSRLFAEHVETAKKWQPRIDQCGQLPREHHQRLRLDRFLLKEDNVLAKAGPRCSRHLRRFYARAFFSIRAAAFAFLVNVGRKVTGLAQLPDRLIGRICLNKPRRFLTAGIESYVSEAWHVVTPRIVR
jgi:hypothetical protein